jgi:GT2 family glycosyltransferase
MGNSKGLEILTTTGFSLNSYGAWLNEIMEASPSEWVMIHDHDIFLANKNWYRILQEAITNKPDAGLFTCMTNRIGNPQQKIHNPSDDIMEHIRLAEEFEKREPYIEATRPISGLMMLTSKTAWEKAGGFIENKIIGLDNRYYGDIVRAGYKVYILNNLYVYHRYRK